MNADFQYSKVSVCLGIVLKDKTFPTSNILKVLVDGKVLSEWTLPQGCDYKWEQDIVLVDEVNYLKNNINTSVKN